MFHWNKLSLFVLTIVAIATARAAGQTYPSTTQQNPSEPFTLERLLPASVAQNLDVNAWGWFSFLHDSDDDSDESQYWFADIALGATERIGDHLAVSAEMHFLDDDNQSSGFLEQGYATLLASDKLGTLITVGKFNANFGIEARDEWDRLTGTAGLLFGAQPQDLLGLEITQPIGETGITLRPFITSNFEGRSDFRGPPSEGLAVEFKPTDTLRFSLTNWIGQGLSYSDDDDDDASESYSSEDYLYDSWPRTDATVGPGGILYLADANVTWKPRPDLTLALEGLAAFDGSEPNDFSWGGAMFLANFDVTDRWRVFGRWSYLNDEDGLVTGAEQTFNEGSVGFGFQIIRGMELRGEYRHDFTRSGDLDTVSGHIVFSY